MFQIFIKIKNKRRFQKLEIKMLNGYI